MPKKYSMPRLLKSAVHLAITTWCGTVVVAEHWYGRLQRRDRNGRLTSQDVSRTLDKTDAERLNKEDGVTGMLCAYRPGDISSRFWSRDDLVKAAVEQWKRNHKRSPLLLAGEGSCLDPQEILAARDDRLLEAGNKIWREFEEEWRKQTGKWHQDWTPEHERLAKKWDRLMRGRNRELPCHSRQGSTGAR